MAMPENDELGALKKKFFIDDEEYDTESIKHDLERLVRYGKISKQGKVLITAKDLTGKERVCFSIVARYIGSKLEKKISNVITTEEISSFTSIEKAVVNARAKELADEGLITRTEAGSYRANPSQIGDFLTSLEAK
jgi:hypothetical protein